MLQPYTFQFLKQLEKNNNKAWFDGHRKDYDSAREDFSVMVTGLINGIAGFDKPIGHLNAKECMFRINRDVRFSKDKRPYKNNLAAYFNKGGKKSNGSGYYLHLEPGKSFAAGGIWMPEPEVLTHIRQEIDYSFADFKKILFAGPFKKMFAEGLTAGEVLKRPPKGYDENNPAIEYIKMKSFIVSKPVNDKDLQNKNAVKGITGIFQAMKPLIDFINRAVD